MKIPLEDYCEDIVGKAQRGWRLSDEDICESAKITLEAWTALKKGHGSEGTARAVAPTLKLHPDKLVDSLNRAWYPEARNLPGLFQVNTPYHDMFVNAYLTWDTSTGEGAIFDTGASAAKLIEKASDSRLDITHVFLTHTHRDHIMDLDAVRRAFPNAGVYVGEKELFEGAQAVSPNQCFTLGSLSIKTHLTWGHSIGGITYVIEGLETPVAIVGDALFAGSMGGGMVSYADALRTNREEILSLPGNTLLCPGHGPMTTVDEELLHNPFF